MRTPWTEEQIRLAQHILRRYPLSRFRDAVEAIEKATGRSSVTPHALRSVFLRMGLGPPSTYCKDEASTPATKDILNPSDKVQKLVAVTKKRPLTFAEICDKLDLSPSKTKVVIEEARSLGIPIHVENDHVGFRPSLEEEHIKEVGIAPVVGETQRVAVISDTHLGSKYCLREQLRDFVHYAYEKGVREILHPGDVLDGMYRHGVFEVSHTGLDAQAQDLFEVLPQLPGLNYRCITGNHDFTFTEASGVDVGHYLMNYFRERGRDDLHFYGNRGAFLKVKGAVVHLWHPRSGGSYAKSYGIQKHIEKYTAIKPQILLAGHWHVFNYCYERAIHGIACPTFQGGGSAFSKSLGGAPAIGGLILSWDITEQGTIRSFTLENRAYFEVEKPISIWNDVDAIPIEA